MSEQPVPQDGRSPAEELSDPLTAADPLVTRLVEPLGETGTSDGHSPRTVISARKLSPRPPSWGERVRLRVLRKLGYEVSQPRPGRKVEFLACAPELVGAIRSGHPRFAHVAVASYLARSASVPARERAILRREFPPLLDRFEQTNGRLVRWYMARYVFAAAALSDRDEIVVTLGRQLPAGSEQLVDLIRRCQQIAYTAWHRMAAFDRRQCQNMIFSVLEEALRRLDTNRRVQADDCLKPLNDRLDEAEEFMLRCATRRAQSKYLKGMLAGAAATGLAVAAVAVLLIHGGHLTRFAGQLLLVATAGAVGAVVSVLWRMTSGSFRMNLPTLNHDMKGTDVGLMAALRPIIGLIFALATMALVLGAVIPVDQHTGATQTALFASIGFLAGFSERLAQDMFVRSGQGLSGVMSDSPSAGPSAGLSPPPGAGATGGDVVRGESGFVQKTRVVSAP